MTFPSRALRVAQIARAPLIFLGTDLAGGVAAQQLLLGRSPPVQMPRGGGGQSHVTGSADDRSDAACPFPRGGTHAEDTDPDVPAGSCPA